MAKYRLFAANYNQNVMWVYEELRHWLADRGMDFTLAQCTSDDEVIQGAQEADIYLAYKFKVTPRVIAALPRLRLLMSSGSGYDHIDIRAATEHGVIVTNAAAYNVEDVAEHALTLILACGRKLRALERLSRQGNWQCGSLVQPTHRFVGQTVGLIGFGKIGRALAWRLKALGFRVLVYDPYLPVQEIIQLGGELAGLQEVLVQSDFISLHLRVTDETLHMLNEARLRAMKPTAFLINTSRGAVVDEAALVRALQEGWIAGAGLDVLEQEPPDLDNPLLAMDNVMVTGHAAGTSVEGIQNWQGEWRKVIEAFVAGRWPINVVNPEVQPKVPLSKER
jgi:D-3-phosphoglycerate dehydrogenase